jgi:pimeloyl-ACP methyl ester carboxylesterase
MLNTPGGLNILHSRFPTGPGAQREPGRSSEEIVDRLKEANIPIILFWGRQDKISPIEGGRERAKGFPLKAFYEVDEAGHHVQSDQADFFNEKALEFLLND